MQTLSTEQQAVPHHWATNRPVALVTGASRGIGLAIARDLALTHHVLVGGTRPETVQQVVDELQQVDHRPALPFVVDLTDADAVRAAVAQLGLERLDVLVHSAGTAEYGTVAQTDKDTWQRMFDVNVFAVADLTRQLLPALRAASGQVIMINSGAGYNAGPGTSAYSASKFALRAMTNALRAEERGKVRVCAVHPGRVDTDMQRELQDWLGNPEYRAGDYVRPETIAATVRLAVDASPEAMIEELTVRPVIN